MKSIRLLAAAAALTAAGVAQAAIPIATTVTVNGATSGNPAFLNDGIFPADGTSYLTGTAHSFSSSTLFVFSFGDAIAIDGFKLNVDHNDNYIVTFYGIGETLTRTLLGTDGAMSFGTETFTSNPAYGGRYVSTLAFPAFTATRATIRATGGDGFYAIGEAQFFAAQAAAVPEPASWALMLAGFGLLGGGLRMQPRARIRFA